jgi:hypothetical protein
VVLGNVLQLHASFVRCSWCLFLEVCPVKFTSDITFYVFSALLRPQLDGTSKRISVTNGVEVRDADQHIFASNSHSLHQSNFNEVR